MAKKGGAIGLTCGALAGGAAGGTAGGVVGATAGGVCGAAGGAAGGAVAGLPFVAMTWGLSLPVGAAIGAVCGATAGAARLGTVGVAVGGTTGSACGGVYGGILGAAIGHYKRRTSHPQAPALLPLPEQASAALHCQPSPITPKALLEQQEQGLDIVPPLSDEFFCPICLELMVDPVTDCLGYTYERAMIEQWFSEGNTTSPISNLSLSTTSLVPNHSLRNMIMMANDKEQHRINAALPTSDTEDDYVSIPDPEELLL